MIELQNAIKSVEEYANNKYGKAHQKEYAFKEGMEIINRKSVWFIPFIEKNEDEIEGWIGAAKGCIVDKETGELFQPGSAYSIDTWIWGFELGFRGKHLDFTVTKINNIEKAIELIKRLGPQYLLNKIDGNYDVNDIKYYTKEEVASKMKNLPCTFYSQGFTIKLWVIKEILDGGFLEFKVKPSKYKYGKHYGELIERKSID